MNLLVNRRVEGAVATLPPTLTTTRKDRAMAMLNITGERFGRLVAICLENRINRRTYWRCRCDCGEHAVVVLENLRGGHTRSCGCLHRETIASNRIVHGKSGGKSRLYGIWLGMRKRCRDPHSASYRNYGARGIAVCESWNDFEAFERWALANGYNAALTLDRINNDGSYEPDNCRWADRITQNRNSRHVRLYTVNGKTVCLSEHAADAGINYWALISRLRRGLSIEDALR